jgi:uncharacterized protein (DUF1499 family)
MKIFISVIVLLGLAVGIFYLFPQINFRQMPVGLLDGHLAENKLNWVSSMVPVSDSHYIAPLKFQSLAKLSACIETKLPQVSIQKTDASTIIAYRQSKIFHFVDWLCIHADGAVTSSATMGSSDFGKNKELIEQIRTLCS